MFCITSSQLSFGHETPVSHLSKSQYYSLTVVFNFLSHVCHEFFKRFLSVIFMNEQHFFDHTLLKAHLFKLSQEVQELCSLKDNN